MCRTAIIMYFASQELRHESKRRIYAFKKWCIFIKYNILLIKLLVVRKWTVSFSRTCNNSHQGKRGFQQVIQPNHLCIVDPKPGKRSSCRSLEVFVFHLSLSGDWRFYLNGPFQCLAKFLLKHEKQNPSPQLKRSYQK